MDPCDPCDSGGGWSAALMDRPSMLLPRGIDAGGDPGGEPSDQAISAFSGAAAGRGAFSVGVGHVPWGAAFLRAVMRSKRGGALPEEPAQRATQGAHRCRAHQIESGLLKQLGEVNKHFK